MVDMVKMVYRLIIASIPLGEAVRRQQFLSMIYYPLATWLDDQSPNPNHLLVAIHILMHDSIPRSCYVLRCPLSPYPTITKKRTKSDK
jgi:hypothetical protein